MSTELNFMFWYLEEGIKGDKFELLTIMPFSALFPSPLSKVVSLTKPVNWVYRRPPLSRSLYTWKDRAAHKHSNPESPHAIPFKNIVFSIRIGIVIKFKLDYCKRPIYIQSQQNIGFGT